jgi:Domain of unknown function (DUF929)
MLEGTVERSSPRRLITRRRRGATNWGLVAVLGVAAIVVGMLVVRRRRMDQPPTPPGAAESAAIINLVISVPQATLDAVGAGQAVTPPSPLPADTPPLMANGKPEFLSVGAEFCPYCAAERWAEVNALARFGTFTGLSLTSSAADDVYPSTPTLTFHGSTFTSDVLTVVSVETNTNKRAANGQYEMLEAPTADQMDLFRTFNAPPYVMTGGSIPFILIGNKYVISGSNYQPDALQGKSWRQIAESLANPADPIAQQVLGAANQMTAAICKLTNGQPAAVCTSAAVTAATAALPAK